MTQVSTASPDQPRQYQHTLSNGLTLLAEFIPNLRSAAMTLVVPGGAASDPDDCSGAATVLSDWLLRGAGSRDSRALTGYLDGLGVQRGSQAETSFIRFSASMLSKNLLSVLPVYADIVQRPQLPTEGFEPAKDLALQQLASIEDEPSHKLSMLLRERHYPWPFGRPTLGVAAQLEAMTADALRSDYARRFTPRGSILSVAGNFDWATLKATVENAFGGWAEKPVVAPTARQPETGVTHVRQETNQVQIGLAYDSVPESHAESLLAQTALNVLSGGMGARLFMEIREKQGLCYSVHAGYHSLKNRAAVFGYSGTAPERAQRTLDSFIVELKRLAKGITADELERARISMKSRVIMQGESSGARAGALVYDFYHRGRTRTLADLKGQIESITLDAVNAHLAKNPMGQLTVVTIGPEPLKVNL